MINKFFLIFFTLFSITSVGIYFIIQNTVLSLKNSTKQPFFIKNDFKNLNIKKHDTANDLKIITTIQNAFVYENENFSASNIVVSAVEKTSHLKKWQLTANEGLMKNNILLLYGDIIFNNAQDVKLLTNKGYIYYEKKIFFSPDRTVINMKAAHNITLGTDFITSLQNSSFTLKHVKSTYVF